jgi:uncharacterized surface protein with fasciclin (FAS1) repeats
MIRQTTKNQKTQMKTIRNITVILAVLSLAGVAHAQPAPAPGDIVAVASGADNLKTLVAAVKAAGLAQTLQGTGPFTVFAPTDDAFAKLPKETLDDLLKPENKAKLAGILTYHVVAGKVMADDVKTGEVKTVNGKELDIKVEGANVTVDGAKVIKTDIPATNGVVHLIDSVLIP